MTWPEISKSPEVEDKVQNTATARATYSEGLPDIELAHAAVAIPAAAAPQASTTTRLDPAPEPAADAAADAADPEALFNIAIAQVLEVLPEIDRVYLAHVVRAKVPALGADTGVLVLGWLVETGAWPREGRAVDFMRVRRMRLPLLLLLPLLYRPVQLPVWRVVISTRLWCRSLRMRWILCRPRSCCRHHSARTTSATRSSSSTAVPAADAAEVDALV
jgi:hypothetical protein